ncbi:MAG: uroporphyrinogen-III synthase [Desulfurococcales archaeon]|nr:uroporphyrinogen-III synthase [Desulfurococcales archaeon]
MEKSGACEVFYFGPENPSLKKQYNIDIQWVPLIHVLPIDKSVKEILSILRECDCLVFTSPRGVRILKELSLEQGLLADLRHAISKRIIAVIGGSTGKALEEEFNIKHYHKPDEWDSYGLGSLLCGIQPKCALLFRAKQSSNILEGKLKECDVSYRKIGLYDILYTTITRIPKIPEGSPIILSSSMIANAFIRKHGCPKNNPVIVLGRMTQNMIKKLCSDICVYVAKPSLLENAIKIAESICSNNI